MLAYLLMKVIGLMTVSTPSIDIDLDITEEKVAQCLKALKPDKSPGPDGIHPLLLQMVADEVAKHLTLIFVKSFNESKLPEDWRRANRPAICRKGARNEARNYRPVSLTSVVCKILEAIIQEKNNAFPGRQEVDSHQTTWICHGRSCLTNLLETLEKWTEYLDAGHGLDVIYLDYRKVFDTVLHKKLLKKVLKAGISGKVLNWIKAFLLERKIKVTVNGSFLVWASVTSGIPQGSVLGPLLFLIYVTYRIESRLKLRCSLMTKLWNKITEPNDCIKLQQDLDSLQNWSDKWLLRFNLDKCKVMHIGHDCKFL